MNDEVFRKACSSRQLFVKIRERQARFLGSAIRKDGMETIFTSGKIRGKSSKGGRVKNTDRKTAWSYCDGLYMQTDTFHVYYYYP